MNYFKATVASQLVWVKTKTYNAFTKKDHTKSLYSKGIFLFQKKIENI